MQCLRIGNASLAVRWIFARALFNVLCPFDLVWLLLAKHNRVDYLPGPRGLRVGIVFTTLKPLLFRVHRVMAVSLGWNCTRAPAFCERNGSLSRPRSCYRPKRWRCQRAGGTRSGKGGCSDGLTMWRCQQKADNRENRLLQQSLLWTGSTSAPQSGDRAFSTRRRCHCASSDEEQRRS